MKALRGFTGLGLVLSLFACSGGSSHSESPTVTTIPVQVKASGFDVSVDLADYISDAKSADGVLNLTVTEVTGAAFVPQKNAAGTVTNYGGFSGTVYSKTFENTGLFTVAFTVGDPDGNSKASSFQVKVEESALLIYDDDGELRSVDGGSGLIHDFSGNDGYDKVWEASLGDGTIVFSVIVGAKKDIYAYMPKIGLLKTVSADPQKDEDYLGVTSDYQVLYAKEDGGSNLLFLYDPTTGRNQIVTGNHVGDASAVTIGSNDDIYYPRMVNGQNCLYHHSAIDGEDKFIAETDDTFTEIGIESALNNGDLVYWKKNGSGYHDLYYYSTAGNSWPITTGNSTGDAAVSNNTSLGHVVYYKNNDANDLYLFNANSKSSVALGDAAKVTSYHADMVSGDYVIYTDADDGSGTNAVLKHYRISTATATTVATATAVYKGEFSNDLSLIYQKSGDLFSYVISTATATNLSNSGSLAAGAFQAVLGNDDVVYTLSNDILYYDYTEAGLDTVTDAGGAEAYEADLGGGKFAYSYNGRIYIWDAETGANGTGAMMSTDVAGNSYQGGGSFTHTATSTAISGTETTTTYVTNATRVVFYTRGNYYYSARMVTTVTDTSVYDSSTGSTTNTDGTPSTNNHTEVLAIQYIDDEANYTDGDEVLKSVISID